MDGSLGGAIQKISRCLEIGSAIARAIARQNLKHEPSIAERVLITTGP